MVKSIGSAWFVAVFLAFISLTSNIHGQAAHKPAAQRPIHPSASAIHFPNNQAFLRLPLEVRANGPFVQVKVNGKGPFNFEVDTGSMTSPVAEELVSEMGFAAPDGGTKKSTTGNVKKRKTTTEFTLTEGLTVPVPASFASFAGLWPLVGERIYGAIGYGVLKHFVVEFDYENKALTLYDPVKYHYSGEGASFRASLMMDYDPQIEGEITVPDSVLGTAPIPVRFTLDTGAGGTVISAPLVKGHNLLERVAQKVPNPGKPKVDGVDDQVFDSITGRITALRLGKYTVDHPLVALSTDTEGTFTMDTIGINLGGNILRRFKVIVDYLHQRVILEPNSHFADPFPADASGLVLGAEGKDYKKVAVHGIVNGSPADEAGLKVGDVITAIDDESTDRYALWQIQDLLRESGQEKRLTVQRGDTTTILIIKLRALA